MDELRAMRLLLLEPLQRSESGFETRLSLIRAGGLFYPSKLLVALKPSLKKEAPERGAEMKLKHFQCPHSSKLPY